MSRKRHALEAVGVYHEKFIQGHDKTMVLYRCVCGCGRVSTKTLDGIWGIEHFKKAAA